MKIIFFTLLIVISVLDQRSFAGVEKNTDPFDLPQVVAVENKRFTALKDITVQVGVLPLDAFYKAINFGLSYTQSYTPYFAWEIINANLTTKFDTNLKDNLLAMSTQPVGYLDSVKYYLSTHAVYTPIYSKNLLFNKDVLYADWSFVGGLGVVGFESGDVAPMFGGGLVARIFRSNQLSYKFDGRLYYQTAPDKSSDLLLMLNLGVAFELGQKTQAGRSL